MKLLSLIILIIFLNFSCDIYTGPSIPDEQEEEEHDQGEIEN